MNTWGNSSKLVPEQRWVAVHVAGAPPFLHLPTFSHLHSTSSFDQWHLCKKLKNNCHVSGHCRNNSWGAKCTWPRRLPWPPEPLITKITLNPIYILNLLKRVTLISTCFQQFQVCPMSRLSEPLPVHGKACFMMQVGYYPHTRLWCDTGAAVDVLIARCACVGNSGTMVVSC